jgi:hypothetical protein
MLAALAGVFLFTHMATLADLTREIGEMEIRGNPFKTDVKGWVNRAIRAIAERREWTWMHSRQSVTILAGATSANLSARFKCLDSQRSPVTFTAPGANFPTPVFVKTRAELERMNPGAFGNVVNASGAWSPFYVFIEKNDDGLWTINVPPMLPYATAATYAISCFLYPEELTAGDDTNGCTNNGELAEAIIMWCKWKALPKSEPESQAARATFNDIIQTQAVADARSTLLGRTVQW